MDDTTPPPGGDIESRVRVALEAWLDLSESGTPPDPALLSAGDPEVERRLRSVLRIDGAIQALLPGSRLTDGGDAPEGERLGEFRILAPLGAGGTGRVFLAEQQSLRRLVALKVVEVPATGGEAGAVRFRREAEIAASLDHPNIVPIHAVGQEGSRRFIAMKWLCGPGLDALESPLTPAEAARIGAAVARALDAAHLAGVVHRDIKPANIILDGNRPYVVDFGLARAVDQPGLTRTGVVPGTLPYLAPEQLQGIGPRLDPVSDIYSLGATLYEIVSGRPPFAADKSETLIRQILLDEPPRLGLRGPDRDLETVILRCLDKDRNRRFPTAAALAEELELFSAGEPVRSRRSGPARRGWRRLRRHPRVLAATLTLLILLVGVATVALVQWTRRREAVARDLRAAGDAVTAWRFPVAETLLRSLAEAGSAPAEVRALRSLSAALQELQDLLDEIHEFEVWRDAWRLDDLQRRLAAAGASPRDLGLARLGAALASLYRDDRPAALAHLAVFESEVGRTRGSEALRSVAENRKEIALPDTPAPSPDDHVFAALALRYAGRPAPEQEAEIDRALEIDAGFARAQFALAVHASRAGNAGEARMGLRCLARESEARPAHRRIMARLLVILGEWDAAEAELRRPGPPGTAGSQIEVVRFNILLRQGRTAEAEAVLAAALTAGEPSPHLLLAAGQWASSQGRDGEARGHLEAAVRHGRGSDAGEAAAAGLLVLDMIGIAGPDPMARRRLRPEAQAEVSALEQEAAALAGRSRSGEARSQALWLCAWCRRILDPGATSFELLARAIEEDPSNLNACLDRAVMIQERFRPADAGLERFRDDPPPLAEGDRELVRQGRRHVATVLSHERTGRRLASAAQLHSAVIAGAVLAWLHGDPEGALDLARQGRTRGVAGDWTAVLAGLEHWAEARLAAAAGR